MCRPHAQMCVTTSVQSSRPRPWCLVCGGEGVKMKYVHGVQGHAVKQSAGDTKKKDIPPKMESQSLSMHNS